MLLQPKSIFSLENVQINDKCDDTGQTQGYIGLFHTIVRNFELDLVTFKLNVTMTARMPVFFKLLKLFFKKKIRAILYLNRTPAVMGSNKFPQY